MSTSAATATPTQAATPTAASTDPSRYGFVLSSQGRIVVRPERSTNAVLAIGGDAPVASHDGKRIPLSRTRPQGNNPHELRNVDVPHRSERALPHLPAGHGGGRLPRAATRARDQ